MTAGYIATAKTNLEFGLRIERGGDAAQNAMVYFGKDYNARIGGFAGKHRNPVCPGLSVNSHQFISASKALRGASAGYTMIRDF